MKNFKSFVQIDELVGVKPKAKKEHDFVHSTYLAQVKDPADLEKTGPEEIGPKDTKSGQGKRPADRLDNKQEFGEDSHQAKTTMKHVSNPTAEEKKAAKDIKPGVKGYADRVAMLKSAEERGGLKKEGAYSTIKAKMKNEEHQDILMALYDELNEANQEVFLDQLEKNSDKLLEFALKKHEE